MKKNGNSRTKKVDWRLVTSTAKEDEIEGREEETKAAQKRRPEYPASYNLQRLSVRPGTECIPGTETETERAS